MKKIEKICFVNDVTGDTYTCSLGSKTIKFTKKTVVIAAEALAGIFTLVTAGIITACRKHKSK